ncbi:ATP-dependent DNA ligase, partial [candidate division WWE3 bacterium]|nr:ATP-dependent DNA ligase [candidate division WWE3 bacterium]
MTFKKFSNYLEQLEDTPSTNDMVEVLATMLSELELDETAQAVYLSLGHLGPLYQPILFNMSEKLVLRAIAQAFNINEKDVSTKNKTLADIGDLALELHPGTDVKTHSVRDVYQLLVAIAIDEGEGSVERKIAKTADLLTQLSPLESKFVARIIVDKLRMGFGEATIMDALSWMVNHDKKARKEIEYAFNVFPDIGQIAHNIKKDGLNCLTDITIAPGVPIRPAKSERLATPEKIVEKLEEFAVEPKMDGFRAQIHVWSDNGKRQVKIYSRNLNDTTAMFPEIVKSAKQLPIKSGVFDSEAIAYNPETDEFLPFQETVKRRRKHGVEQMSSEIPLRAFIFDALYLDGVSLLDEPFTERFSKMTSIGIPEESVIEVTRHTVVNTVEKLRTLFDQYVSEGLEGIMCKKMDATYQAGARNFNWVKYKRATDKELDDTIDAIVLGYYFGRGQRARFGIGAFLIGVMNKETGTIESLAKVGTGLTDEEWVSIREKIDSYRVGSKPSTYNIHANLTCDVWVKPAVVVEIAADEITRSPSHSASGSYFKEDGVGLALRF